MGALPRSLDIACAELNSTTTYIAEQVSHHPPVSAFYFSNRKAGFVINGVRSIPSRGMKGDGME